MGIHALGIGLIFSGYGGGVSITPPLVSGVVVSGITPSEFQISANVTPNGEETTVELRYGLTSGLGETPLEFTGSPIPASPKDPTTVTLTVPNLQSFRKYYYRVVATNSSGSTYAAGTVETLSIVPGLTPFIVHSLRKVNPAYSGPAIRVRRSLDNTELDIGFTGRVLDTAALLTFVGSGDGYVRTLYDQVGVNHVHQSNTARQPLIALAGAVCLNKDDRRPTILFNTIYQSLQSAVFAANAQPFTKLVSCNFGAAIQPLEYVIEGSATNRGAMGTADGAGYWRISAGTAVAGTVPPLVNTEYVMSGLFSGAGSILRANRTQVAAGNAGAAPLDRVTYGQHPNLDVSYIQFYGHITEGIIFTSNLGANLALVEAEMENYLITSDEAVPSGVTPFGIYDNTAIYDNAAIWNNGA